MSAAGPLDTVLRQATSVEELAHRPWPLPRRGWTMGQTWEDLLFAHWRVPHEVLAPLLPEGLELDTHDGDAWIGVAPFRLTGLRVRGLLPLPRASSFLELNVRTYATAQSKPGIWFFSLDASSALAVELARRTYCLPYFRARIGAARRGEWIVYECARTEEPGRAFRGRYRPVGEPLERGSGSLEWFLTERYCLYAVDARGRLCRAEIHHRPWRLQPAEAEIELNTMAPVQLPDDEPLCHFARRLDAVIWPLERLGA
jgi:uncharacterized protein YqjF (DUF2071 family)